MPSPPTSAVPLSSGKDGNAHLLQAEYDQLRAELQRLMMAPVRDFLCIDQLVDQLELLQLAIKEAHGLKGNNPNE